VNDRSQIVLVTGAAGFAGSHLVEYLAGRGEVTGWTRSDPPAEIASLARWTRVDLLDRERVRKEIRALRPTAVYHCAGAAHVADSWQDTALPLASNVLTTHYLLDSLRRAGGACRVVIPGSATVYAASASPLHEDSALAPASPYALSKLAQEQLGRRGLTEDGIDVIVTRAFNHTGPRQSPAFAVAGMARQIAHIERGGVDPVIRVGNLDTQRDLTDVRDTVRAYALLMERGVPGTIYNVASGVARPMRAVLDALVERSRVAVGIALDPARLRPHDIPVLIGDSARLRAATGWAPLIGFDRMLDDLLAYWRTAVRA
jgi:GDP-4-dehydro-6-deoxy-D-mannose reductase